MTVTPSKEESFTAEFLNTETVLLAWTDQPRHLCLKPLETSNHHRGQTTRANISANRQNVTHQVTISLIHFNIYTLHVYTLRVVQWRSQGGKSDAAKHLHTHEPLRKFTVKQTLLFEPRFSHCRGRLCFSRKKRLPPRWGWSFLS